MNVDEANLREKLLDILRYPNNKKPVRYSIRAIGKMFKMHPESVRYRMKELNRNKYVEPAQPHNKEKAKGLWQPGDLANGRKEKGSSDE